MPNISTTIQKLLDSGDYRLVEPDDKGVARTYPGEIIMNRDGIILAYTANVIKNKILN